MNKPVFYNSGRNAALLRDLLETDVDTAARFEIQFRTFGMDGFFENLESLDVPDELKSRLTAVKDVLALTVMGLR